MQCNNTTGRECCIPTYRLGLLFSRIQTEYKLFSYRKPGTACGFYTVQGKRAICEPSPKITRRIEEIIRKFLQIEEHLFWRASDFLITLPTSNFKNLDITQCKTKKSQTALVEKNLSSNTDKLRFWEAILF